jgi:hypothetical protein
MTEWPAMPGEACTYCEDSLDCPAAALEKELKADVEANGPIQIEGLAAKKTETRFSFKGEEN